MGTRTYNVSKVMILVITCDFWEEKIGTMAGLTLAAGGWIANLIVYLIQEFNIKSISAAKIYNVVNGSITMFPIIGAIVADSFVGCFSVIWFSSLISLLVLSSIYTSSLMINIYIYIYHIPINMLCLSN